MGDERDARDLVVEVVRVQEDTVLAKRLAVVRGDHHQALRARRAERGPRPGTFASNAMSASISGAAVIDFERMRLG